MMQFASDVIHHIFVFLKDDSSEVKSRIVYGVFLAFAFLTIIICGGAIFDVSIMVLVIVSAHEYSNIISKKPDFLGFKIAVSLHKKYEFFFKIKYGIYLIIALGAMSMSIRSSISGLEKILYISLLIASCDVAAYVGGKKFGRNKLCPAISPGKTWEGLFFGLLGALIFAVCFYFLFHWKMWFLFYLILSTVLAIFSQVGDLMESHLKRIFGAKDSGVILKGHGGVMDRFDGYIVSLPLFFLTDFVMSIMNVNYC